MRPLREEDAHEGEQAEATRDADEDVRPRLRRKTLLIKGTLLTLPYTPGFDGGGARIVEGVDARPNEDAAGDGREREHRDEHGRAERFVRGLLGERAASADRVVAVVRGNGHGRSDEALLERLAFACFHVE